MKIAILVAMDKELSLLLHQIKEGHREIIDGHEVTIGRIGSHEVLAAKCGIGKVNATLNTLSIIRAYHPELVINSGVAGGAGTGMKIGDLLVADRAAYHDVWCGPGTLNGQADDAPLFFETYAPVLEIARGQLDNPTTAVGLICTGDRFISENSEVRAIRHNFPDVKAVDMESAAIGHVCMREKVPFCIIRVVSDTPGEGENLSQYKDFWSMAPETTFGALTRILDLL